jgi:hypothetical protein
MTHIARKSVLALFADSANFWILAIPFLTLLLCNI